MVSVVRECWDRWEPKAGGGAIFRGGRGYLRGEQGESDRIHCGEMTSGCARAAHAAHLDTKPQKHYSKCEGRLAFPTTRTPLRTPPHLTITTIY